MVKQSLGLPSANYRLRPDTRAHILHYPHRSIVRTDAMRTTNFDERPGGQNFIVAIMSLHGYNMQDAVIMNRASVDRGLGRSTFNRTYNAERRRFPGGQVEEIEKPGNKLTEVKGLKPAEAYFHLEDDGLPLPETYLEGGDVLVGKTSPPRFLEESNSGASSWHKSVENLRCSFVMERKDGSTMSMSPNPTTLVDWFESWSEVTKFLKLVTNSLHVTDKGCHRPTC